MNDNLKNTDPAGFVLAVAAFNAANRELVTAAMVEHSTRRPTTVCICGSSRLKPELDAANRAETLAGRIVLTLGVFGHADPEPMTENTRRELNALHRKKIYAADEILVVTKDGRVGESLDQELILAFALRKTIRWLEGQEGVDRRKRSLTAARIENVRRIICDDMSRYNIGQIRY